MCSMYDDKMWAEAGFTGADGHNWSCLTRSDSPAAAMAYRAAGFTWMTAEPWVRAGLRGVEAAAYTALGASPSLGYTCRVLGYTPADLTPYCSIGLTAEEALSACRVGIAPEEVEAIGAEMARTVIALEGAAA